MDKAEVMRAIWTVILAAVVGWTSSYTRNVHDSDVMERLERLEKICAER